MPRPKSNNPPCPQCGGKVNKNAKRKSANGTDIQRYRCMEALCGRRFTELTKDVKVDAPSEVEVRERLRDDTHVFLITWAQNATPIHEGFWAALGAAQKHRDADLIAIKGMYKNPNRLKEDHSDDYWCNEVMAAGLWDQDIDLCEKLTLLAGYPVTPTATRPLSGMDAVTGGKSGIVGHPKLEMRSIATPQNDLPKQMQTTGACTIQNYSRSKMGKKGEFHHTIGGLIVEIRDDVFHMRQLNACRDGSFIDLDTEYLPDGTSRPAARALALSMGDWHSGFTAPHVIDATFGVGQKDCIVGVLKPREILWDDVLDQYSRNHHHKDNPFIALAKDEDEVYGRNSLMEEVDAACEELNYYTRLANEIVGEKVTSTVKSSNHDEALTKYIINTDWTKDPVNMKFYLQTASMMAEGTTMKHSGAHYPDAFHCWMGKLCDPNISFLGRRGSHMIGDIECIFHGDIGPNGARGSIASFAKIGVKTVIGHSHTPGIVEGCYQVGTSTLLDLEYAKGASSWSNTHCVIYANGKRALITIIDGKWRHD